MFCKRFHQSQQWGEKYQSIETDVDRILTFMTEIKGRSVAGERDERKKRTKRKRWQNSKENARRKDKRKRNR